MKVGGICRVSVLIGVMAIPSLYAATFTVSKDGRGAFSTIQAAVDKAGKGDVVEILDASVYPEQVTINSTKSGLTLKATNPAAPKKPTIQWKDVVHQNPKTCTDALDTNKIDFDQNGALRLLRVRNVTIDGIAIDGVAPTPFAWADVWGNGTDCNGQKFPLFHGNGGIALFVSGAITIRNCDIFNAYFGIAIKDRNEGGVYANVNPADLAKSNVVPLSGFGQTGAHVIEKNRIHNNSWGYFSESSWDLGSTFRYNLVYENHHANAAAAAAVKAMTSEGANQPGGAMLFKDVMISPTAIYNNTFWHNFMNFVGGYRPGAQHLIFNNIFAAPSGFWAKDPSFSGATFMALDPFFVNRMHNSVYAVQNDAISAQAQNVNVQTYDQVGQKSFSKDTSVQIYRDVRIMNGMAADATGSLTLNLTLPLSNRDTILSNTITNVVLPGALILGTGANTAFPAGANVRWLDVKFQSTDTASSSFLTPDWTDSLNQKYVMNAGWPQAGIYNSDGKAADLGAIPSVSRPTDDVVIRPLFPAVINGDSATLNFDLSAVAGNLTAPKVKYVKMVRFAATNLSLTAFGGTPALVLAPPLDVTLSSQNLAMGANTVTASGFPALATGEDYAFFEVIAEGTGSNGKTASTNVGFIPYRRLDYKFVVQVLDATTGAVITQAKAGETVGLRIIPERLDGTPFTNVIKPIAVSLNSGADLLSPGNPMTKFTLDSVVNTTTKTAVFTKVPKSGLEYVSVTGIWLNGTQKVPFVGQSQGVKILPADPAKIVFQTPPSKSLNAAPILDPGITYAVKVQVLDTFDNHVVTPVSVSIQSEQPLIGDIVGPATASTDSNGTVSFGAAVTKGVKDNIFTLKATLSTNAKFDEADIKVGQPRNKIWVLYSDTLAYNDTVSLHGTVGQLFPVTIRGSVDGNKKIDTLQTLSDLTLSAGLVAYASPSSVTPLTQVQLVNGQAVIYLTGLSLVTNGTITLTPTVNTVLPGFRDKIYFVVPPVTVTQAAYFADNGLGQVNRLEMYFADTLLWVPDSLTLHWPDLTSAAQHVSTGITWDPANKKHVTVALATPFPANQTAQVGTANLGTLYTPNPAGAGQPDLVTVFAISDSVGPLLDTAAVQIQYDTGNSVLEISFTEKVNPASLVGASLSLIKAGSATAVPLNISSQKVDATGMGFTVTVSSSTVVPAPGDSLKINAAGPLTDMFTNKANPANRPVVLKLKVVPPPPLAVLSAAFFADNGFGRVDRVEIHMVKDLAAVPDSVSLSWPDNTTPAKMVKTGITWDPADKKHVTVSLVSNPFPVGITVPTAATAPGLLYTHVPVVGAPVQVTPLALVDSVGPLLDSAMVRERFEPGVDTLFLSFSEPILASTLTGNSLILIKRGLSRDSLPLLIVGMETTSTGGYTYKVVVEDLGAQAPVAGDSLKLNPSGPLSDANGNLANALNRPVYLRLLATPRPPNLTIHADHPFITASVINRPDFVVLGNSGGSVWTPVQGSVGSSTRDCVILNCGGSVQEDAKGNLDLPTITLDIDRPVHYSLELFTNLGEVVNGFSGDVSADQLGWDANGIPDPTAGIYKRDSRGMYHIKIVWNGRSTQSRLAGTGAYIARASMKGTAKDANNVPQPVEKVKVIRFGFVRQ